jgi:hypothetical protein
MLKILNCENCEPIYQFTILYTFETSVGFLFNLYLGISFSRMHIRYSDIRSKNDRWREIWIRIIEGI